MPQTACCRRATSCSATHQSRRTSKIIEPCSAGGEETILRSLDKATRTVIDWCAHATYARNTHDIPFSIAARSLVKVGRKTTNRDWQESRDVCSKPTAVKYVEGVTALREPPEFDESGRCMVYVYDQVHRTADRHHKQRIGTTALECVKGDGSISELARTTYVNWFRIPIPASLVDLDQADLDRIREVGPLSQTYDSVYLRLKKPQVLQA